MKNLLLFGVLCLFLTAANAAKEGGSQGAFERSIGAVVRNKYFYKTGKFELGITAGVTPYDSLVNHYLVGAKIQWHLSDHFGWEVVDGQLAFSSVTSFLTNLVTTDGLSNVQTAQLQYLITTNFLLSPLYGKIRFFGSQVLYFDTYVVLGGGVANTKTIELSSTQANAAAFQTTLRQGIDPAFDFGLGFKIFMTDSFALLIDLRDYMTLTQVYGASNLTSNYTVFLGASCFLPSF